MGLFYCFEIATRFLYLLPSNDMNVFALFLLLSVTIFCSLQ